ncbi:Protein PHYTOCHROME KINASE SUBSTRATE 2 [Cardamine amara subsp. amara]|uniref:Protein PHYTOCHROME KINASE SUBSTRATE 2 n=1 Tax=Cardamine amara subsp. amara TaxID=228776 RepID=A0ABD1ATW4_CARAN
MATLTSSSSTPNISFDFMRNNNNTNNLYGPFSSSSSTSFSYLTSKEDALTQKKIMSGSEDLEISVFGAEKYFNGDMDSDHSPRLVSPLLIPEVSIERIFVGPKQSSKNSSATPSLRSESSWNSQSLLLQNRLEKRNKNKNNSSWSSSYLQEKDVISNNQKVSNKKSFLSNLGCRCVCSNWSSVDVVDDKRRSSGLKKIKTQLSFSGDLRPEMKINQQQQQAILEQRKSLEIFGSPLAEKRSIQKKFPWEYSSSSKTNDHGFSLKHEEEEDGNVSDISTDLFEIESLKGKAKPFLARQGSSDPDSPNGYAPSEVSIAWSVVTASVADFSVMSECATSPVRNRSFQIPRIPIMAKSNRETAPQRRKSSSGGLLLGCKSHKSVRVSGDSYTSVNRTPSYAPRFPVEANQSSMETRKKISSSSVSHTQSPFLYT